jgi:hypothetical protein
MGLADQSDAQGRDGAVLGEVPVLLHRRLGGVQIFNANYPGFSSPLEWAFTGTAFQKAIVWSIFYELCGLRLRLGSDERPLRSRGSVASGTSCARARPSWRRSRSLPLLGGITRSWLDVAIYAANQLFLVRALVAPELTPALLLPNVILIPLMGLTDKTLYLAARAEHYYVALVCITAAIAGGPWVAFCKLVWCFIWFWAATSKVNDHFPSVIQVMMNNGPFFPTWLKTRLFANYPDDLRPGQFAIFMSRMGTLTEWAIPFVLAANISPLVTALMLLTVVGLPRLHRDQQSERHAGRVEHPDDLRRDRAVRLSTRT